MGHSSEAGWSPGSTADADATYEAPRLTIHGSLAEQTAANAAGAFTDAAFPANTPVSDLTFSG